MWRRQVVILRQAQTRQAQGCWRENDLGMFDERGSEMRRGTLVEGKSWYEGERESLCTE